MELHPFKFDKSKEIPENWGRSNSKVSSAALLTVALVASFTRLASKTWRRGKLRRELASSKVCFSSVGAEENGQYRVS